MAPFFPIIHRRRPTGNKQLSVNTLTLELDPDDPEAEDKARQKTENGALRLVAPALRTAQQEFNDLLLSGRLAPAEMQALLTRYQGNFTEALAESMRRVARQERSDELQQAWRYAISRTVDEGAAAGLRVAFGQLGNVGISLNYDLLNRFARDWAQTYSYNLITRIDASTGRQVGHAVSTWMESGQHLDALIAHLDPVFGRNRAEMIAATETTRAFAEGTLMGYRQSGQVEATEWKTAQDERVCPICWPLHGQRGDLNGTFRHPGGIGRASRFEGRTFRPPSHVRCRCALAPVVPAATIVPVAKPPVPIATPAVVAPVANPIPYSPPQSTLNKVNGLIDKTVVRLANWNDMEASDFEAEVDAGFKRVIQHDLAIQFKSENMEQFLGDPRFKSQFETRSSGGILNTDSRAVAELNGMGVPMDIDAKQRPIYGYLNLGQKAQDNVGQYGDITFLLKEEVRERTTVTMDDSLANFRSREVAGMPINEARRESWDGILSALQKYHRTGDPNEILDEIPYVEIQVHGGVSISDVRGIIDREKRLTTAQRQQLQQMGVVIWDN